MNKIKNYPSIARFENKIIEEKLDGSNFCFVKKEDGLHFYSRNYELDKNTSDKFFLQFINLIEEIEDLPMNLMFFGEALGMARIKYFFKENVETRKKLYIFDIKNLETDAWLFRKTMIEVCERLNLNVVPLTEENIENSVVDPKVRREGIIYRFEKDQVIKLKKPEVNLNKYKNRSE